MIATATDRRSNNLEEVRKPIFDSKYIRDDMVDVSVKRPDVHESDINVSLSDGLLEVIAWRYNDSESRNEYPTTRVQLRLKLGNGGRTVLEVY